jgi:sugar lactone lactonase YvrE
LWVLGGLGGVCVDGEDHVLILNRQDVIEGDFNAGRLAPPVIEFDPEGEVVNSWGNLDDLDPRLHACHFGPDGNVWVASAPSGMVRQYSHDGTRLLSQIGEKGALDSSDGTEAGAPLNSPGARFFAPSSVVVDRETSDVYVADGEDEGGNLRIKVFDRDGAFLRQWQPEGMTSVHCLAMARDGTIYVCNRLGSRIQTYDRMGIPGGAIEVPWEAVTPPDVGDPEQIGGSAVAIAFSPDPEQQWLFVINQNNARVEIIARATGAIVGSFGRAGSYPGQFDQAHGIAVDSQGNVYIAENRGRRVHKFRPVAD